MLTNWQLSLGIIIGILLGLGLIFISCQQFSRIIRTRNCSPRNLLKDFGQKMWMTIGLGILFFGFYILFVLFSSWFIDQQIGIQILVLAYYEPVLFIDGGLFLFALFSLLIYLARMFIKYIYLKQNWK